MIKHKRSKGRTVVIQDSKVVERRNNKEVIQYKENVKEADLIQIKNLKSHKNKVVEDLKAEVRDQNQEEKVQNDKVIINNKNKVKEDKIDNNKEMINIKEKDIMNDNNIDMVKEEVID
jgi:hypothetical protein